METEFAKGFYPKAPSDKAPDYVKFKVSLRREELIEWLNSKEGVWVNLEVKEGRSGKWYASVDNWKPAGETNSGGKSNDFDDDIPF